MEDPYLLDQNKVQSQLSALQQQLQRWRQLRDTDQLPGDPEDREELEEEFDCLTGQIVQLVKSIGWELDDLQETLQMMVEAKAPQVTLGANRDSRAAFVARWRSFLDEVSREVAMSAGRGKSAPAVSQAKDYDAEDRTADDLESEGGRHPQASRPLITWRKDTDQLSFPSVELDSLMDVRKARFHNRDWTGCFYRYRYLLAMLATACLIVFLTVVVLAAKHTAASARTAAAASQQLATTVPTKPPCRHPWVHLC